MQQIKHYTLKYTNLFILYGARTDTALEVIYYNGRSKLYHRRRMTDT